MGVSIKSNPIPKPIIREEVCALKCSSWNIRRGLIKRELELKNLLYNEKIDIIFLTETDTKNLSTESDYLIQEYKTILPIIDPKCGVVRIISLVKENLLPNLKVRSDLMSKEFPSIWLEFKADQNKKSTLIAGFY